MEYKIEISEGCTCYSYTINGIEYGELIDKGNEYYDPELVYNVLDLMVEEISDQKKDNNDLITLLDDVLNRIKLEDSQWFFERLFHLNNNTKITDSYYCDQCGDTVITYSLVLKTK